MEVLGVIIIAVQLVTIAILLQKRDKKRLQKPIILMENSKINTSAMNGAEISFEELMSRARLSGYFNLGDIDTAVLETNGEVSFLLKHSKRRLNPCDFNFSPVREGMSRIIISDGIINEKNLRLSGIRKEELFKLIEQRGSTLADILFATANEDGRVDFYN